MTRNTRKPVARSAHQAEVAAGSVIISTTSSNASTQTTNTLSAVQRHGQGPSATQSGGGYFGFDMLVESTNFSERQCARRGPLSDSVCAVKQSLRRIEHEMKWNEMD
jgi:hypothetical protein